MYLHRLQLHDFRNWERLDLELAPGTLVFHGPNGAGKTSLLEAICLTATGESPRSHDFQELIRLGAEVAFARAEYHGIESRTRLEAAVARTGQKQLKVNGAPKRRADLIGLAPLVYFSADDIGLIKGDPSSRRRFLDTEISALSRPYYSQLLRYRRSLEQRNSLLRDLRSGRAQSHPLGAWDRALARYGAEIILRRQEFIAALAPRLAAVHASLTGEPDRLLVEYRPSIALLTEQDSTCPMQGGATLVEKLSNHLEARLGEERQADIARGSTASGPHRDDLEVLLGGEPARSFGSQGEQRTCAVALRLGLAAVIRQVSGENPVLLLDDVLSELDARYRAGVFAACEQAEQVIITCCDPDDIPRSAAQSASFEVNHGQLV